MTSYIEISKYYSLSLQVKVGPTSVKRQESTNFLVVYLDFQLIWKNNKLTIICKLSKLCGLMYHTSMKYKGPNLLI